MHARACLRVPGGEMKGRRERRRGEERVSCSKMLLSALIMRHAGVDRIFHEL